MKISILILIVSIVQVSASTSAQTVTINENNVPMAQVLKEIRKQSGYKFIIDGALLRSLNPVSVSVKDATVQEALSVSFSGQQLSYEIVEKTIFIKRSEITNLTLRQELIKITGKVTDQKGNPLPGVTVRVKGTNTGTVTDAAGNYTIDAEPEEVLVFTFVGYRTFEIKVDHQSRVDMTMIESTSKLDQIQVIGYGTTSKRLNTGNTSSVSAEVIGSQPVTNPLQALAGRVAGVQVIQSNGLPGAGITVQIRGRNSLRAEANAPLYIVDGVPFSASAIEKIGGAGGSGEGSPLNLIAPSDIESIDILKDADATAIYGSRGANGVVLITTKKGAKDKPSLSININNDFSDVEKSVKPLSTKDYLKYRQDALKNSNLTPTIMNAPDLTKWDQSLDNKWENWIFGNTAKTQNITASLRGGSEQLTYLISGSYRHEIPILPGSNKYSRSNFHISNEYLSIDKRLRVGANVFYTADAKRVPSLPGLTLQDIVFAVPNYPIYTADAKYNWEASKVNYVALLNAYQKTESDNVNANIKVGYAILRDLNIGISLGYSKISGTQISANTISSFDPNTNPKGNALFGNQFTKTFLAEPQLTYNVNLSDSKISLLFGSTIQTTNTKGQQINIDGYTSDLLLENTGFGSATYYPSNNDNYRYLSIFGRVNFNWANKYILNTSIRQDGSTRFGANNKFGFFGSAAFAWLFTNEKFISNFIHWLSSGKLRGSYGTTGNDIIGNYGYLSLYQSGLLYGTIPTINPSQLGNPNFKWETNKKLEVALELGFFKDRVLLSTAWYRNRSGNQLVGFPLPATTGFTSYQSNLPALVQNQGIEFELSSENISTRHLRWSTALNFTMAKNRLLSFNGIDKTGYASKYIIGKPLNNFQLLHFTGLNPQSGLATFEDYGNNGLTLTSSYNNQNGDYIYAGTSDPKFFAGISNSADYKRFHFEMFVQMTKQDGYNLNRIYVGDLKNTSYYRLNYWTEIQTTADVPKPTAELGDQSGSRYANSTAIISDASFIRLKNVSISYLLPINKLKTSSIKFYVQGQNLVTFTKYRGYDAESAQSQYFNVPVLRTLSFGIQCSL